MTSIECFGAALIQDDPYDRMMGSTQRRLPADPPAFHHKGYRGSPAGGRIPYGPVHSVSRCLHPR